MKVGIQVWIMTDLLEELNILVTTNW